MSNPIFNDIRNQLRGSSLMKLILINTLVFIAVQLTMMIGRSSEDPGAVADTLINIFTLQTPLEGFLHHPWGILTSIFSHFTFMHFILNMLVLYFAGSMFLQFFSSRRLVHLYVIGGIFGGLTELLIHNLFPGLVHSSFVLGASGSIMAIFIAMAFYRPNIQVLLFGVLPLRLIVLAGIYLLSDLLRIGSNDGTAHFAHLGGALIGFLSVQKLHSSNNIINISEMFGQKWKAFWSNLFTPKSSMRVKQGGARMGKTDEEYNLDKKAKQEKINKILDKISKSGYESLTKAEKEFLFSQSKNE